MRLFVRFSLLLFVFLSFVSAHTLFAAAPPARIVSLAPNITEIIYELNLDAKLVGVTRFCDYPPAARSKPQMGGFANPSAEAILLAKPDIVVMTTEGNPFATYKKLQRFGFSIYIFNATTISALPIAIKDMGIALGAGERANGLADSIAGRLGVIQANAKKRNRLTAVCIVQIAPLIVAGSGSHIDEAMVLLNLNNIAVDTLGKYPKFSWEEIFHKDPDIILLALNPRDVANLKVRLAHLKATKNDALIAVDDDFLRLSPRIVGAMETMELLLRARGK